MHNRRDYERIGRDVPDNIDVSRTGENIVLVDKDIRDAYKEIFGEALQKFNDKQKRADRKIEDYLDHVNKSKNGEKPFYEDVIQWGSMDDFKDPANVEKARDSLLEYVKGFEDRNPNLKLIGAYLHMDEASPHLHLDYVPVAHGYKRGLETRNSLDRAMKEMGFRPEQESRKNNATKLWKEHEREVFGSICRSHGLEVEQEREARGSLSVAEYKEARDSMLSGIEHERSNAEFNLFGVQLSVSAEKNNLKSVREEVSEARESLSETVSEINRASDRLEELRSAQKRSEAAERRSREQAAEIIESARKEAEEIKAAVYSSIPESLADRLQAAKDKIELQEFRKLKKNFPTAFKQMAERLKKAQFKDQTKEPRR
jgi:hypothetical protein